MCCVRRADSTCLAGDPAGQLWKTRFKREQTRRRAAEAKLAQMGRGEALAGTSGAEGRAADSTAASPPQGCAPAARTVQSEPLTPPRPVAIRSPPRLGPDAGGRGRGPPSPAHTGCGAAGLPLLEEYVVLSLPRAEFPDPGPSAAAQQARVCHNLFGRWAMAADALCALCFPAGLRTKHVRPTASLSDLQEALHGSYALRGPNTRVSVLLLSGTGEEPSAAGSGPHRSDADAVRASLPGAGPLRAGKGAAKAPVSAEASAASCGIVGAGEVYAVCAVTTEVRMRGRDTHAVVPVAHCLLSRLPLFGVHVEAVRTVMALERARMQQRLATGGSGDGGEDGCVPSLPSLPSLPRHPAPRSCASPHTLALAHAHALPVTPRTRGASDAGRGWARRRRRFFASTRSRGDLFPATCSTSTRQGCRETTHCVQSCHDPALRPLSAALWPQRRCCPARC